MKISCGIVPSLDSVEQATLAEERGYDRAWLYDSPAIYADIWITMARIAEHTGGPGAWEKRPEHRKMISRDKFLRSVYDKVPPPPPHHFRGADKITAEHDDILAGIAARDEDRAAAAGILSSAQVAALGAETLAALK